ncbi:hypothetical protein ACLOJK_036118 [Asimina triloba]
MERSMDSDKGDTQYDAGDDARVDGGEKDDDSEIMVGEDENVKGQRRSHQGETTCNFFFFEGGKDGQRACVQLRGLV